MEVEQWKFVVTEWSSPRRGLGEVVDASARQYTATLNRPSTASFTIRLDHKLAPILLNEPAFLQVWQGTTLRFWGPIISVNLVGGEEGMPTLAVAAADPAWLFSKIVVGQSEKGTKYVEMDKGEMIKNILDGDKHHAPINVPKLESGSTGTYTVGPYIDLLSVLSELGGSINGFDWYVKAEDVGGALVGSFVLQGVVGTEKPNAVFEYGTGKNNARSFNLLRDMGGLCNVAIDLNEGVALAVYGTNLDSVAQYGALEEVVTLSGVSYEQYRIEWVEANVAVRGTPRRIVSLSSDFYDDTNPKHIPIPGFDYWLGDLVPVNAEVEGKPIISGMVRVYQIEVSLNENGSSSITPTLVEG